MQLAQLIGLIVKPSNRSKETAISHAIRKALDSRAERLIAQNKRTTIVLEVKNNGR